MEPTTEDKESLRAFEAKFEIEIGEELRELTQEKNND